MTDDEFRVFALSLPEVSEGEHSGCATFLVRGRRFATLGWPAAGKVAMALDPDEADLLVAASPEGVTRAPGAWGRRGHVELDLAAADEATVRSMVGMAWRRSAPKALLKTARRGD